MKLLSRKVFTAILASISQVGLVAAELPFQFSGYALGENGARFALKKSQDGKSYWLEVGQQFEGYTVLSFDKVSEVLTVRREGKDFRVRLPQPKVSADKVKISAEKEERILRNLRILAAAADQYYLEKKEVVASYETLVALKEYVKEDIVSVDGENYRAINFSSEKMEVLTTGGHTVSYLR
ncbi:hypothetical protein [Horticoccus sp. 23ND18S-11]|uniref:hypothetical protein n=1 Tax=Horticoccus sp. 23ND18S-11 TaxID=3391832 RepID=UPI0039C9922F